ncbi:hypothetical protein A3K73_04305 [Candidatus Pacearchaeota archaeon RBG_13_36_9]|nr:MAG: hypothetical protein A3K73_04305 [Candidatus Pacearchaeota archaeon RBG_13_36_9]
MPNMDKTGPAGQGPMTGRGLGPCGGGMRRGCLRGFGMGRGFGFGYRRQVTLTKDEEKKILEADLKDIEVEKEAIQRRLKEMK